MLLWKSQEWRLHADAGGRASPAEGAAPEDEAAATCATVDLDDGAQQVADPPEGSHASGSVFTDANERAQLVDGEAGAARINLRAS